MQVLKVLNPDKSNSGDERLTSLFNSLMGDVEVANAPKAQLNFLEQEVKKVFDSPLVTKKDQRVRKQNIAYLPFLSEQFQKDLAFLVSYPGHFLQNIKAFLKLYGFLYTVQLSLNIKGWAQKPEIKPCYFILDSEKASKERTKLQLHGHKQVIESSYSLFPYLALNESLQDTKEQIVPLWHLFEELADTDIKALNKYAVEFYINRSLTSQEALAATPSEAISYLAKLFTEQFKKGNTRETPFNNFVKATRETLIKPFEQNRRRAGSFLVLNQDYLLLLTNLCIGENEKLRLHELLIEFQKRGVFFDKSSEECLIDLFERMGNVERMSDSGDAVYVKKTI
ncbi:DNA phosphorothioation-dependent restriction protein DptG [Pseudoalteromonas sp. CST4]|nr:MULTISPECIES: DNA phosphorothioation-dependent restriction protein DptG [unclassified Pseudoalteromonas]MDC9540754.1 DNA phosphorothioation-dependent restriction protein DptG [Pseudoalteromonas sp. CST2]MDC9552768.1 DNA phosphorothioation-dependent restriction protein DptG [Pseudoalteromonas sp. CST7]MDC9536712.1 DNA phosphorothioation-dependent restriction protein DptG [Pseudoalteromonas sp. CST3]MDC9545429.1 DNA phosphorothioation-dependent restriction protein DptG [Pseudoalteromonas sp. C